MAKAALKAEKTPGQKLGEFWSSQIEDAQKAFEKWEERSKKVIKRYRDEREAIEQRKRKFNILWSNVQVLKPALYGRMPKPEVSRRYRDADPVGRTAALMLERCLEFEVEQYSDFGSAMSNVVEDRLLPGRGAAWVRYEIGEESSSATEDVGSKLAYECAPTDYVNWQDFRHSPARTWEEVWWVARRVWMTRDEGVKRFGVKFKRVPLGDDKDKRSADSETPKEALSKKAQVWEIWDKTDKSVVWIAKGLEEVLDEVQDPLQLESFFPCPKPVYATTTTGSLVPVPDYAEYQDQAEEIDILTNRITMLTKALKMVGVYDATQKSLKRMFTEGMDNDMIPVDTWAAFAEKGGIKGTVQFVPVKEVADVLVALFEAREQAKQGVYEIMGIGDIIRGSTDPDETLGAQQLKANFGSMRLRSTQGEVARFATDILRMKAQIICKFYSPETIVEMSGIQGTPDAEHIPAAMQLLKSGRLSDYRISVESDTLAQIDDQQEKAAAVEMTTAIGAYFKDVFPVVQAAPPMLPLVGELLMFNLRRFRVGRTIESAFEKTMAQMEQFVAQPPPPDPKLEVARIQAQTEMAVAPVKAQAEQAKAQAGVQKAGVDLQRAQVEAQMLPLEIQAKTLDAQAGAMTAQANLQKAQVEASTMPQQVEAQRISADAQVQKSQADVKKAKIAAQAPKKEKK
jgi:hypothetical protein